jgi:hypothetical protein
LCTVEQLDESGSHEIEINSAPEAIRRQSARACRPHASTCSAWSSGHHIDYCRCRVPSEGSVNGEKKGCHSLSIHRRSPAHLTSVVPMSYRFSIAIAPSATPGWWKLFGRCGQGKRSIECRSGRDEAGRRSCRVQSRSHLRERKSGSPGSGREISSKGLSGEEARGREDSTLETCSNIVTFRVSCPVLYSSHHLAGSSIPYGRLLARNFRFACNIVRIWPSSLLQQFRRPA